MMNWKTICGLFLVFQIYLIIGMIAFNLLESNNEGGVRQDTRDFKEKILANFTCLTTEDLESLIATISNAINNGVDPSNNVTNPSNWGYQSTYFFSGTVITTIGYGYISPSTNAGRTFCIFYALIGIPICGILLSALADRVNQFKDSLLEKFYLKFQKKWQRKAFSIIVVLGSGILFFIIIPAFIFEAVEGWTYIEAWYYCFITLTTVGFGDFVAGQNPDINYPMIYKVMVFYWIILGLVFLAIIIQDISDVMSSHVEKIQEKAEEMKRANGDKNFIIGGQKAKQTVKNDEILDIEEHTGKTTNIKDTETKF